MQIMLFFSVFIQQDISSRHGPRQCFLSPAGEMNQETKIALMVPIFIRT